MNRFRVEQLLKMREDWRDRVYPDSLGVPTLGWGHNVRDNPISQRVGQLMLDEDIEEAEQACQRNIDGWYALPSDAQDALVILSFAMGISALLGFHDMLNAIAKKDWKRAGDEVMDSQWMRQVHYARANEVADLFRGIA